MAATDKIYTDKYKEYKELFDWAKNTVFVCPNGTKLYPIRDIYQHLKEEDFKDGKCVPVLMTSFVMDYFLIKNCPFDFVQESLKSSYGEEYYNSVKNGTSEYDLFTKEGKCGSGKIKRINKDSRSRFNYLYPIFRKNGKKIKPKFFVDVYPPSKDDGLVLSLDYSYKIDNFLWENELGLLDSDCYYGCRSIKALIRKIRKWKLPKGSMVHAHGRYRRESWYFVVK